MLRIKGGHYGARLPFFAAIAAMFIIIDQVLTEAGIAYELSGGMEGQHQKGSFHYLGLAFDFAVRSEATQLTMEDCLVKLKDRLADDFDVVLERKKVNNIDRFVFHAEFQPKEPFGTL